MGVRRPPRGPPSSTMKVVPSKASMLGGRVARRRRSSSASHSDRAVSGQVTSVPPQSRAAYERSWRSSPARCARRWCSQYFVPVLCLDVPQRRRCVVGRDAPDDRGCRGAPSPPTTPRLRPPDAFRRLRRPPARAPPNAAAWSIGSMRRGQPPDHLRQRDGKADEPFPVHAKLQGVSGSRMPRQLAPGRERLGKRRASRRSPSRRSSEPPPTSTPATSSSPSRRSRFTSPARTRRRPVTSTILCPRHRASEQLVLRRSRYAVELLCGPAQYHTGPLVRDVLPGSATCSRRPARTMSRVTRGAGPPSLAARSATIPMRASAASNTSCPV